MYLIGLIFIILDIIPGFFIMVAALRLHKYIVNYIERTKGKISGSYNNFLAFIIILIASIIIVFVSLYTMKVTTYVGHLILPNGV